LLACRSRHGSYPSRPYDHRGVLPPGPIGARGSLMGTKPAADSTGAGRTVTWMPGSGAAGQTSIVLLGFMTGGSGNQGPPSRRCLHRRRRRQDPVRALSRPTPLFLGIEQGRGKLPDFVGEIRCKGLLRPVCLPGGQSKLSGSDPSPAMDYAMVGGGGRHIACAHGSRGSDAGGHRKRDALQMFPEHCHSAGMA
jgi:hypothetical protein